MAKCTAVIDIGSNSMRMAVFQKTSRFAFHIIHEVKSSVRLSENAYRNDGELQPEAMERTSLALGEFLSAARSFGARKILCVATSALRDAPNSALFISRIRRDLGLQIKVIDGEKEAYYGGLACANLLPRMDAVTVDVGGGSSEFTLLKNGKVERLASLNLGTVRLKELFLDHDDLKGAIRYIDEALATLPPLETDSLIGIGGTFRAITRSLMKKEGYPLKKLHAYTTDENRFGALCDQILEASSKKLKSLNIKPDRFDTIKPGALILQRIIRHLGVRNLVCSGVGVREGVYLGDLLRNAGGMFPANYNPSLRYLLDTHAIHSDHGNQCARLAGRIYDLLEAPLNLGGKYRSELIMTAKLIPIGIGTRYYAYQRHSHYLALNALDYGLSHSQIALISHLLLFKKGHASSELLPKNSYEMLLPDAQTLDVLYTLLWLSHIVLASRLNADAVRTDYAQGNLVISGENLYLAKEQMKNIVLPANLTVTFTS
ncbi:MAG: Ppx/GppA family phosphatase [Campylobacterales bacterium]|nr:Ppx/GppA family phosphatase [Campylobacterales bacterium]